MSEHAHWGSQCKKESSLSASDSWGSAQHRPQSHRCQTLKASCLVALVIGQWFGLPNLSTKTVKRQSKTDNQKTIRNWHQKTVKNWESRLEREQVLQIVLPTITSRNAKCKVEVTKACDGDAIDLDLTIVRNLSNLLRKWKFKFGIIWNPHLTLRIRYWKKSIPVLKKNQVQYYWKSSGSEAWNSIPWSILILVWYWFGIDPDIGLIWIAISIWYWSGNGLAWSIFDLEFTAQKEFSSDFTASSQRKTSFTASSQRVYSAKLVLQRVHSEFTAQN